MPATSTGLMTGHIRPSVHLSRLGGRHRPCDGVLGPSTQDMYALVGPSGAPQAHYPQFPGLSWGAPPGRGWGHLQPTHPGPESPEWRAPGTPFSQLQSGRRLHTWVGFLLPWRCGLCVTPSPRGWPVRVPPE